MPGWSMPVCEMDMRVGGKYRWRWRSDENGQEFGFTGEILEVALHSRIVHTQIFDAGDLGVSMGSEPSIITVTFHEANGITNVATSIKYASKADRDAAFSTGMTDGMEMSYKLLDGVLAGDAGLITIASRSTARSASPVVHRAANSRTTSLMRNCPGRADKAGNPARAQ